MTHAEYLFLREQVETVSRAEEQARNEGEVYHDTRPYLPLEDGLEARARKPGGKWVLELRSVRHPRALQLMERAFGVFFSTPHYQLPVTSDAVFVYSTVSEI